MTQPDHKLELENQFILRLPQVQASVLRQAIKNGGPLSKRLSIKFDHDIRHGCVRFDNWSMPARLFDLPTITESYKTLDRKNFYKTADISQILICKEDPEFECIDTNDEETKKSHYDKLFEFVGGVGKREFLYPHGVTPPLKNVRKRRFRKTLRKKYVDFSEIEKEVKRLFKFDCEAIKSRYEIVEENKLDGTQPTAYGTENAPSPSSGLQLGLQSAENSQNIDVHELFGEESSSSDDSDADDEDEDDKDDEIDMEQDNDHDNEDDMIEDEELEEMGPEPSVPAVDIAAEIAAASDLISQNDNSEEKKQELNRELMQIRRRIQTQEDEMHGLDNQALRMRLQPVLDSLHEHETAIIKQLEELK